jgi:hypothetical protein
LAEGQQAVERCQVQRAVLHVEQHEVEAGEAGDLACFLVVAFQPEADGWLSRVIGTSYMGAIPLFLT